MLSCIKVKICGITRLKDAMDACDLGADILGFNFVPASPRYLNPYTAKEILASLPPFICTMGIFADEDLETVNELVSFLGLDAVQLHGSEDPMYCRGIKHPTVKAIRVASAADLEGFDEFEVWAYLLDAKADGMLGGSGRTFPWEAASGFSRTNRIFAAGGLTPGNVGDVVRILDPYAVDTASGVESEPGIKDAVLMESFIRTARCAGTGNGGGCVDAE